MCRTGFIDEIAMHARTHDDGQFFQYVVKAEKRRRVVRRSAAVAVG